MKLYNTLSSSVETFLPQEKNVVKMYVCGITPYDEIHIGHGRCYVIFDVLRRYLQYKGYKINYVQNFTDVDDKIINKAKELNKHPSEISQHYINSYYEIEKKLNITPAKIYPKVTEHIDDIIISIENIIKKGFAYVTTTGVYFDTSKFKNYGKLSKKNLDELQAGSRIEVDETKKSPLDFALWKFSKQNDIIFWESPWGNGRPGWHIECSVMSMKYLGETLDIHGGGMDLIFPHHENEIAQSESLTGKNFVNYWVHNGFVTVNQQKMSKSLGNIFALKDIFEIYDPMIVRLFLISQHYQKPLDFSIQEVEQFKSVYQKLVNFNEEIKERIKNSEPKTGINEEVVKYINVLINEFETAMDDNLNTSSAMAVLHKFISYVNKNISWIDKTTLNYCYTKFLLLVEEIFGIKVDLSYEIPEIVQKLVSQREIARRNRDFETSDKLRAQIFELGYIVEDTLTGPKVKKRI
ncbi:MAG: cysteine--tRNA ligase [Endomicrobia bacterium]|nr:cysteine--tRNA ligase [Endomicrobiia bacterium]